MSKIALKQEEALKCWFSKEEKHQRSDRTLRINTDGLYWQRLTQIINNKIEMNVGKDYADKKSYKNWWNC